MGVFAERWNWGPETLLEMTDQDVEFWAETLGEVDARLKQETEGPPHA